MRTKKKSTLAKLKEKKLREQGSSTSLQSYQEKELDESPTHTHSKIPSSTGSLDSGRAFSTKDPSDLTAGAARPKPRPRSRRQSSANDWKGRSKSEDQDGDLETGLMLQEKLKDLTMSPRYGDGVDPAISNSGFIPKPPVTPRSQSSNPRTPRGLLPSSKGEKRPRDYRSSGEENEVEQKREKSAEAGMEGTESSSSNYQHLAENKVHPSHKTSERLLKRRSSKDSGTEAKTGIGESSSNFTNGIGKPPVYNPQPHRNTNTNSNHSRGNDLPYPSSAGVDSSVHQSPRGKYLKSANKSCTDSSFQPQEVASNIKLQAEAEISQSRLGNDRVSSPSRLSETTGAKSSPPQAPGASLEGYTEADFGNKSTQVMYNSESPWKVRPVNTPPSPGRLGPISPRPNPPPPLMENFSSQSLRTAFRIDPNVRPSTGSGGRIGTATASSASGGRLGTGNVEKSDSGGATSNGDRVSQQSFASGSVLPVITTKEARSRCEMVFTNTS